MNECSLYIHVPFCRHKCLYCDFFSGGERIADWELFSSAVHAELAERRNELKGRIVSIYFGGGTPSLIPGEIFTDMMSGIKRITGEENLADDCEITIEANPEDVDENKINCWKRGGVNRVSLGVQTFNDTLLYKIGRHHDGRQAMRALDMLSGSFSNVSADLIFGLPEETLARLREDISILKEFSQEHISIYSLMYEDGTALTALRDAGRIKGSDENLSAEMFLMISDMISSSDFRRYEISNYALAGFESRHNIGYWTGRPYMGLGPGAHSYDGNRLRKSNPRDIKGYVRYYGASDKSRKFSAESEFLSEKEMIEEMIMLRMRMCEGLSLDLYSEKFGKEEEYLLMNRASPLIERGILNLSDDNRLTIAESHILTSDSTIISLLPE